jgi:TM2 domain-containing membrane protein YozV
MKILKRISLLFIAVSATVVLTSALPSSAVKDPTPAATTVQPLSGKMSYKQLRDYATQLKGAKLTLKEQIALKLFGKKLSRSAPLPGEGKSQLLALILCFFVGGIGIHRFYLGYTWQGVVQLLTLGACGIWSLIDFIRIITGDLKPKDGEYGTTL